MCKAALWLIIGETLVVCVTGQLVSITTHSTHFTLHHRRPQLLAQRLLMSCSVHPSIASPPCAYCTPYQQDGQPFAATTRELALSTQCHPHETSIRHAWASASAHLPTDSTQPDAIRLTVTPNTVPPGSQVPQAPPGIKRTYHAQASPRLDAFLTQQLQGAASRGRVQAAIRAGHVLVNGRACTKAAAEVKLGDVVEAMLPQPRQMQALPEVHASSLFVSSL